MPLPKALNQALNGRPMLSLGFGTFVGGSSISSIYASYYFGDIVGNWFADQLDVNWFF
jgi:hypothetical protein